MRLKRNLFISLVILLSHGHLVNAQDEEFESFLQKHINKAITNGQLNNNPLIIIEGLPIDTTNIKKIFTTLEQSDIKELKVLGHEIAGEIFDNAKNGVLLVVCNRKGKKKLRKSYKNDKKLSKEQLTTNITPHNKLQ